MSAAVAVAAVDVTCTQCGQGCWDYEARGDAVVCVICLGDELEAEQVRRRDLETKVEALEQRVAQADARARRYRTQVMLGTPDARALSELQSELRAAEARLQAQDAELREVRGAARALRATQSELVRAIRGVVACICGRAGKVFRAEVRADPAKHVDKCVGAYGPAAVGACLGLAEYEVGAVSVGRLELTDDQVNELMWLRATEAFELVVPGWVLQNKRAAARQVHENDEAADAAPPEVAA